jgi:hypothetical protein
MGCFRRTTTAISAVSSAFAALGNSLNIPGSTDAGTSGLDSFYDELRLRVPHLTEPLNTMRRAALGART